MSTVTGTSHAFSVYGFPGGRSPAGATTVTCDEAWLAARLVARRARSAGDLWFLLDVLGIGLDSSAQAPEAPPRTGRSAGHAVATRGKARP